MKKKDVNKFVDSIHSRLRTIQDEIWQLSDQAKSESYLQEDLDEAGAFISRIDALFEKVISTLELTKETHHLS